MRTIEITTEENLTPRGDCIVGVGAACGCAGLPERLKRMLRSHGCSVACTITAGDLRFTSHGRGDPGLTLSDPHDIVIRKTGFVCPRTLAIACDAASDSIPRRMVRILADPDTRGTFSIEARADRQEAPHQRVTGQPALVSSHDKTPAWQNPCLHIGAT